MSNPRDVSLLVVVVVALSVSYISTCCETECAATRNAVRSCLPVTPLTTTITEPPERPPIPPDPIVPPPAVIAPLPKPVESFKPTEEPNLFTEKPAFLTQPKPISHSPKISPSSIPNPSPSVTATKQAEPGYPNYNSYLYSIPGYSAFQPVSFPGVIQPNQASVQNDVTSNDFVPFPKIVTTEAIVEEKIYTDVKTLTDTQTNQPQVAIPKPQTDFEEHFTPEIIPAVSVDTNQTSECKLSITSLTQGSGSTVTIPSQIPNKDTKTKTPERFSLKTSIPISKLDLKCVNTPPDPVFTNTVTKKVPVSQPFQNKQCDNGSRVEIQSNIVIKSALDSENKEVKGNSQNNSISTLINAAEAINKTETQFKKPDTKSEISTDVKDLALPMTTQSSNVISRPLFNPINVETNKTGFLNKPPDGSFNEQKNQILFIQNKNATSSKMLLTIQQQNPQVLLQRTNFDSKNLQAPSRLSNQNKKCKEEVVNDGSISSKVVALKRLHQENCDENDFENLITENQIYGNKIVVKEKSQGTSQEQDLKSKGKIDKPNQNETKNVVLQPNFLYLSNVQFPANLMMIKNNTKVTQSSDVLKTNKVPSNENKTSETTTVTSNIDSNAHIKNNKSQNITVSKEIHVLKSSNNVLQTLSNKNNKTDLVFQTTNQKVIMNPQIVYQVPMIVESDNKPFINMEYSKFVGQNKKDFSKPFEQNKSSDKLFIACPYQMDSKLQPKIVITNIRPKISRIEEVSSLDIYEKRRKLRRLKYLSNRESKELKSDIKKSQEKEKTESRKNIITPEKMSAEIYKEFANTKITVEEGASESDSDYGEDELKEYNSIIKEFTEKSENDNGKVEFMSSLRLATLETYKEKELERQEKILKCDSVASAYIAAGRLDKITCEEDTLDAPILREALTPIKLTEESEPKEMENGICLQRKQMFLSQLKLMQVSTKYKEGYERVWQVILKERKRRDGSVHDDARTKQLRSDVDLDTNGQLRILTEIKKSVNETNNLIKKRLDSNSYRTDGDSIRVLAEKNFSELNRLSKLADRSVKLFSGQETRKRDLNPGFDSENIQKPKLKPEHNNYPSINIPNISKIISLRTTQEQNTAVSTQATSMDEPQSSAAGVKEMFKEEPKANKTQDFSCQAEDTLSWLGLEAIMKSYKEFDTARRKEIADLHRRNTSLRVECAHVTRAASRDSDRARALLAERQHLAVEENSLRTSIQKLCATIEAIRNY
ncbi:unnamed protein product [Diatraea saccharalis]|uniref:Uncharacterized protein n=1 Tax=Diatraea saccharalis TaxID=40085 RepID=A0A9N9WH46_9NEOP|nr:unnamed protein product [Diatraea saccharalis]